MCIHTAIQHICVGPGLRVVAVEHAHSDRVAVSPQVDGETSHRYSSVVHITHTHGGDHSVMQSDNDTCDNLCGVTM